MAIVTVPLADLNDGQVQMAYTYDDVTNVIQSFSLTNTGPRGTMTGALLDRVTGVVLFGPISLASGSGTSVVDVRAAGLRMSTILSAKGLSLVPPFVVQASWAL